MTKAKRGLGKGLGAFFGEEIMEEVAKEQNGKGEEKESASSKKTRAAGSAKGSAEGKAESGQESRQESKTGEIMVKLSKIEPNGKQPRKEFNQQQLQELADSIRQYGVLQPLLVQKKGSDYEIIAGERRWRAAKMAGAKEVPVVIREYSTQQAVEIALIENVQREDLNPIEEAMAYQRLMQEFQLRQEEIAEKVSKNRTTITNSMRLLNLPGEVQEMLINNRITGGHARALLALDDPKLQLKLALRIEKERLSVREAEKIVRAFTKTPREKKEKPRDQALELIFGELEERLKTVMGTKVNINRKDRSKGKIEIEYYSEAELERIVELIESVRQ